MEDKSFPHDWAAYYQAAYEKEKKKNILLAGKIADAEAKEADLAYSLDRIQGSVFWKLSAPVRKCYHMLKGGNESGSVARRISGKAVQNTTDADGYVQEYYREIFRQKHPYLQWIAEHEKIERDERNSKTAAATKNNKCNYMNVVGSVELSESIEALEIETIGAIESIEPAHFVNGWKILKLEDSDTCVIMCGRGILDSRAEEKIKSWFNENKSCAFAYADEDYYWKNLSNRMHPWYKPSWSPDTLLSFCYIGHMIIIKRPLYNFLMEQTQYQDGSYADFYDLCLRLGEYAFFQANRQDESAGRQDEETDGQDAAAREKIAKLKHLIGDKVGHIEEVLFHNCYEPDPAAQRQIEEAEQSGQDVLETVENLLQKELEQGRDTTGCDASFRSVREAALRRRGIKAHLETGADPDIYHVVYEIENDSGKLNGTKFHETNSDGMKPGMVSAIIPSKDHPEALEKCLSSFRDRTDYENYEWIVVDNGSNPENKSRIEAMQKEYGFHYLYEPMEFNFSAMCNLGAQKAQGEYLLLLNDDIEIIQKDWLRIMVGQAGQPHVGAVGAKLWYAGSDMIQHAGITNLKVGPSHKLTTLPDDRNYYYGRNQVTYDVIGVTAACLLIAQKKYWEVGGMDESMKVAYNDVDFCFKLIEAGYYNVLRNDAVLYHDESLSRGHDEEEELKWNRLLREKENLYTKHPNMRGVDDFYHKNLIDDDLNYTCNFKAEYKDDEKMSDICHCTCNHNLLSLTFRNDENAGNAGSVGNTGSTSGPEKNTKVKQGVLQLTIDQIQVQRKDNLDDGDIMVVAGWSYLPGEDNARYTRTILLQKDDGTLCQTAPFPWYRKDVEIALTDKVNTTNVALSGFVIRFEKEALPPGAWKIGMMAENMNSQGVSGSRRFLTWSDKQIIV